MEERFSLSAESHVEHFSLDMVESCTAAQYLIEGTVAEAGAECLLASLPPNLRVTLSEVVYEMRSS